MNMERTAIAGMIMLGIAAVALLSYAANATIMKAIDHHNSQPGGVVCEGCCQAPPPSVPSAPMTTDSGEKQPGY